MRVGFSVGDRVVIARGAMARPGTVGTVRHVHDSGVVNVAFSSEESSNVWRTDIDHAPEREPRIGDRVKVVPGENGNRPYRCGQVGTVVKDGPHVYTVRFPDGSTANYIGELLKVLSREDGDTELEEAYSTAVEDLYRVRTKCARMYDRMREAENQRDDLARILKEDKQATGAFKKGDWVRINWPGAIRHNHVETILEIDGRECKVSRLTAPGCIDQWWPTEHLERVDDQAPFKQGDLVRVIRNGSAHLGREGRVLDVFSSGRILVTVEPGRVGTFLPDELESADWRDDEIKRLRAARSARTKALTELRAERDALRADLAKADTERLWAACNTRRIQKILEEG